MTASFPRCPLVLLHLTDLHFGRAVGKGHYWNCESTELQLAPHNRRGLLGSLHRDLRAEKLEPDLVLVTGDLLDRADPAGVPLAIDFLVELASQLKLARSRVVLIPGNHDVLLDPDPSRQYTAFDKIWTEFYGTLRTPFDLTALPHQRVEHFDFAPELGVEVIGFNSCEELDAATTQEHGSVKTGQRDRAEELLDASEGEGLFRIALMHHHLERPVGKLRDDYSVMDDAAATLEWLVQRRFHLVLNGHQHVDWQSIRVIDGWTIAIAAGASAGVSNYGRSEWNLQLGYQVIVIDNATSGRRIRREYNPQRRAWTAAGRDASEQRLRFGAESAKAAVSRAGTRAAARRRGDPPHEQAKHGADGLRAKAAGQGHAGIAHADAPGDITLQSEVDRPQSVTTAERADTQVSDLGPAVASLDAPAAAVAAADRDSRVASDGQRVVALHLESDLRNTNASDNLWGDAPEEAYPGLVVIFSDGRPACHPIRLDKKPIDLGRVAADGVFVIDDDRVSRRHTRIILRADGVRITDLESRNGTFVDGHRIADETFLKLPKVLRLGQTLLLFVPDIRPFVRGGVQVHHDTVIGPTLRESHERIVRAAQVGDTLLLTGPRGSGKELAARAFHMSGVRPDGPFVAINCAAIPSGLAERLLFGACKGAYSGANADAEGYIQAADRGTLFLDEIAELDINVQLKLLRVLEMREVLALGASHPRKVDIKVCAATLKDLRAEVTVGRFREDLYDRIGRPEVRLPPLGKRSEEIPWLTYYELMRIDPKLAVTPLLLETCLLRPWPGNVREFLGEVRQAARIAINAGRPIVEWKDLSPHAGLDIVMSEMPETPLMDTGEVSREAIEAALKREGGNMARAARQLGMHRNQLWRWLVRNNVDPKTFRGGGEPVE
jgi:transcriptional regulator with AAA-type ATPase domain/3',5'-cyclic AMP phosphodiesterase CpdA